MKRLLTFAIPFCFLVVSCGTKKAIPENGLKNATARKVIKLHEKTAPDFKTLHARIRGSYDDGSSAQSISISMRIKKNDTIWLSAKLAGFIPLAKVLITPQHVQFYDKINQQYFDGNFALLSRWLGTPLNFQKVQHLLLGQALYPLDRNGYDLAAKDNGYQLKSLDSKSIVKLFLIDKTHFRLKGQQFKRPNTPESITISYPEYQHAENIMLPKKIRIIANQKGQTTKINIDYRTFKLNEPVRFPFEIPTGYTEITLR